jgi:hypothetical protein
MTEHAMRNTTPPAADLFEIIRTTRSVRRIKSAGIPKWGGHPPTATRTTRWPVTPRGLGRGTGLLGENPGARRRSRRMRTAALRNSNPQGQGGSASLSAPAYSGKTRASREGVRKLEIRSQAQGRFSDARRAIY